MTIQIGNTLNVDYTLGKVINSSTNSTVVANKPSAIVAGDIILFEIYCYNSNSNITLTPPDGATVFATNASSANGSRPTIWYLWKLATGSEPSTYTATFDKLANGDDLMFIRRVTGANTTGSPIGAIGAFTNSSGTTLLTTGLTTTVNGSVVFNTAVSVNGTRLITPNSNYPANFTGLLLESSRASSVGLVYGEAIQSTPIAATVIAGATWTNVLSASSNYASAMFEIIPQVASGSITNVNGNNVIVAGSTNNTITATGTPGATTVTLGANTVAVVGSNSPYTFTAPGLVDGQVCSLGQTMLALNATGNSPSIIVTVQPPAGLTPVTLAGTLNTSVTGALYNFNPAAVAGDLIIFPSTCFIDEQGNIDTNYNGTQLLWHIEKATGIARSFNLITFRNQGVIIDLSGWLPNHSSPRWDGAYPNGNRP